MENKDAKQCHKIFISELITMIICGYLVYLLSSTLETGLDIRLILPGAILIFTLLQGCGYWLYRDRSASGKSVDRELIMKAFVLLKKITPFVIAVYPLFLVVMLIMKPGAILMPFNLFGLILLFFSVIEYINYYHFDVNIWNFKARNPSDLARELAEFSSKED
ncbi:MAG: hypothetical protein RR614_01730 [Eubacterium sp.]